MKRSLMLIAILTLSIIFSACTQSGFKSESTAILSQFNSAFEEYVEAKEKLNEKKYGEASNKALEAKVKFQTVFNSLEKLRNSAKSDKEKKLINTWIEATEYFIDASDSLSRYITLRMWFDPMTPIPDPSYYEAKKKVDDAFKDWMDKESKAISKMNKVTDLLKQI